MPDDRTGNSERARQVEALFDAARVKTPEDRARFLDAVCGSDVHLRRLVQTRLDHDDAPASPAPSATAPGASASLLGRRIGIYEFLSLLGVGGMGEVYRARDTSLDREVAIKVLPAAWLNDADRRVRFSREARVLAALSHPYIAAIYGVLEADTVHGLVLELVEGPTLADRLARGPLPLKETLQIARQLSEALEEAHSKGIIHRDLKPANLKIASKGMLKVLDFGLAKVEHDVNASGASQATTMTMSGTREGVILGTVAYMSPEQARGKPVDKRTDTWAFGCIVYEMLTGRRAFDGESVSDILAAVLQTEPNWAALPASVPPSLRRLLARCLEKDPARRLREVADSRFDLEDAANESDPGRSGAVTPAPLASSHQRGHSTVVIGTGVVLVAALAIAGWLWWPGRASTPVPPSVRPVTTYRGSETSPTFSPDGKQVAFAWDGERNDNTDIYVLSIGSETPLRLTTSPAGDDYPSWSPDGSQIAFVRTDGDRSAVYVISNLGSGEHKILDLPGQAQVLCPGCGATQISWSTDSRWVLAGGSTGSGIVRAAADGSTHQTVMPGADRIAYPTVAVSPNGRLLAYTSCIATLSCYLEVIGLDSTLTAAGPPKRLTAVSTAILGVTWPDTTSIIYSGQQVGYNPASLWRVSAAGGSEPQRLDLAGIASYPAASPANHRLAFSRRTFDMNMWKLVDGRPPEQVAASSYAEYDGAFSPDGTRIAFATDRTGEGSQIWITNANDSGTISLTKGAHKPEGSPRWSPDGKRIVFDGRGDDGRRHIFQMEAAGGEIHAVAPSSGIDQIPSWSRDGKWIYFGSDRSGQPQVWRAPVEGGRPEQVTRDGGSTPIESADGLTIYYRRGEKLFFVPSAGGPEQPVQHVDALTYWNFDPVAAGVYFVPKTSQSRPPYTYDVRFLDFASGKVRTIDTVQGSTMAPGLAVTPDGKTILLSYVTRTDIDVMMIDNFR